ncbi:hypothetical protein HDV05_005802 [Chytridiales sp. JEL 0842]|nr:hypothetical protein HDV05_005802 [Chytridiales sp. JEL 0842]
MGNLLSRSEQEDSATVAPSAGSPGSPATAANSVGEQPEKTPGTRRRAFLKSLRGRRKGIDTTISPTASIVPQAAVNPDPLSNEPPKEPIASSSIYPQQPPPVKPTEGEKSDLEREKLDPPPKDEQPIISTRSKKPLPALSMPQLTATDLNSGEAQKAEEAAYSDNIPPPTPNPLSISIKTTSAPTLFYIPTASALGSSSVRPRESLATRRSATSAGGVSPERAMLLNHPPRNPGRLARVNTTPNPLQPPRLDLSGFLAPSSLLPDSPMSAGGPKPGAQLATMAATSLDPKVLPSWLDRIAARGPQQAPIYLERLFQSVNDTEKQNLRLGSSASADPKLSSRYSMKASSERGNLRRNRYMDIIPYDNYRVKLVHPTPIVTPANASSIPANERMSDYINASYLNTCVDFNVNTKKARYPGQTYISTQGPLAETVGDFWGMVWDQNSYVIVMLTKEEERGRIKCYRYWPDRLVTPINGAASASASVASSAQAPNSALSSSSPVSSTVIRCSHGPDAELEVRLVEQKVVSNGEVILREFKLSRGTAASLKHQAGTTQQQTDTPSSDHASSPHNHVEHRTVWHVHYLEWPDHKSSNANSVLSVIDIARSLQRANPKAGPMVVHCSAGCGRTGTFCTIDSVLEQLESGLLLEPSPTLPQSIENGSSSPKTPSEPIELPPGADESDREDPIFLTVLKLRMQRINMVQTLEQFAFCYEAVVTRMIDWLAANKPITWTPVTTPSRRTALKPLAEDERKVVNVQLLRKQASKEGMDDGETATTTLRSEGSGEISADEGLVESASSQLDDRIIDQVDQSRGGVDEIPSVLPSSDALLSPPPPLTVNTEVVDSNVDSEDEVPLAIMKARSSPSTPTHRTSSSTLDSPRSPLTPVSQVATTPDRLKRYPLLTFDKPLRLAPNDSSSDEGSRATYESDSDSDSDYSNSSSRYDDDSDSDSSNLGTVRRRQPRATPVVVNGKSSKKRSPQLRSSHSISDTSSGDAELRRRPSGWFDSLVNTISSFIDPVETPEIDAETESKARIRQSTRSQSAVDIGLNTATLPQRPGSAPLPSPTPMSPLSPLTEEPNIMTAQDWFLMGKKYYTSKRWTQAAECFEKAAASSNPPHAESLKSLVDIYGPQKLSHPIKAAEWQKKYLAVMSSPEGLLAHGRHLRQMGKDDPKKEAEGIVLIRQSADKGFPEAMVEFGTYLRDVGKGGEAMAWFHKAAEQGYAQADEKVAEGYENGLGVPRDVVAGAAWRARVTERKRVEHMIKEKQRIEDEQRLEDARLQALKFAKEKEELEEGIRKREADILARRALDIPLRNAIRNVEWGIYITTGIEQLTKLVADGNIDAREYLDPELSTIPARCTTAMYYIGQYHASLPNLQAAAKWFKRCAESGYHEAMVTYAAFLLQGKGVEHIDQGQAIAWLMKAWESGKNKEAALALGEAFTKGIGVPPSPEKAVTWYTRAFDAGGYSEAAFALGLAYATGFTPGAADPSQWSQAYSIGDPTENETLRSRTEDKPRKLSVTAATRAQSFPTSTSDMPVFGEVDAKPNSSISPLSPRSDSRHQLPTPTQSRASSPLPVVTLGGIKPVPRNLTAINQDMKRAAEWYKKAADLGHSRACNNYGELFMTGRGVAKDDAVGVAWFKRAANNGLPEALYNVGRCYREGRGCVKDEEKALNYFIRAHNAGISEATKAMQASPYYKSPELPT